MAIRCAHAGFRKRKHPSATIKKNKIFESGWLSPLARYGYRLARNLEIQAILIVRSVPVLGLVITHITRASESALLLGVVQTPLATLGAPLGAPSGV